MNVFFHTLKIAKHALEQMVVYVTFWSHHYFGHGKHYGRFQIWSYSVENDNNNYYLWCDLAQIAIILGFSNTTIAEVLSDHITM